MDLLIGDKVFIVAGGTSGMGLAAATALAGDGATIAVIGRDAARATAAANDVAAAGAKAAIGLAFDVSQPGSAQAAVADVVERFGRLDGVAVTTGLIGHEPFDISDDRWIEVMRDVLLGTTRTVEAALPHLAVNGGTIVTTSAYSIRSPEIARLPYSAMKSAVATFTKGIAKTYGAQGIRANCICPGAIETSGLQQLRAHTAETRGIPYEEALERIMVEEWGLEIALERPGKPAEVGELIAFLLSPRAGYLTGSLINIDGGTNF
ncbi:SDR family NAD(P)-dependent oxidoreductase [Jatrophihabitans sp. DSM 45814]